MSEESDKKLVVRAAMSILGRSKSPKKKAAGRKNAAKARKVMLANKLAGG